MDLLHLFLENTIAIEHLKNLPHQIKSKRDPQGCQIGIRHRS